MEIPPLPAPTTAVRQTLADLLQAFMAERNIRWGELMSLRNLRKVEV